MVTMSRIEMDSHDGTPIDSHLYVIRGGPSIDDLMGIGILLIDLDYLTIADMEPPENIHTVRLAFLSKGVYILLGGFRQ
ncbi:MAG: hypothetical protein JW896_10755 [Deltaproteobacteria bacterium]|nr:hypothetical protein [Deltaproteobacteria bacterium]